MRTLVIKVLLGLFAAVILLVVVAAAIGVPQARPFLVKQLGEALQCPVSIGAVAWMPPVGVRVRAFEAQSPAGRAQPPWLKADAVAVRVALWSLLLRRTVVADLDVAHPTLTVEQLADGRLSLPAFRPAAAPPAPTPPTPADHPPSLLPHRVRLIQGTVVYRDHRQTPPWLLTLDRVSLEVVAQPRGVQYRGTGVLLSPQGSPVGTLRLDGDTAFDGQTAATVALTHQALPQLAPYIQPVMGAAPTAGELSLTATITGRPDALTVRVHLETVGLAFPPEAMTAVGVTAAQLIPLLQDEQQRIELDFTITGRWDELQVGWNDLIASAVQQLLRRIVTQRLPNILLQGLSRAISPGGNGEGESPDPLDGLKAWGEALTKSLKDQLTPPEAPQDDKGAHPPQ